MESLKGIDLKDLLVCVIFIFAAYGFIDFLHNVKRISASIVAAPGGIKAKIKAIVAGW